MDDAMSMISSFPLPPSPPRITVQVTSESQLSDIASELMEDAISTIANSTRQSDLPPKSPPSPPDLIQWIDVLPVATLPSHAIVNKRFLPSSTPLPSQNMQDAVPSAPLTSPSLEVTANPTLRKPADIKCTMVGDSNIADYNGFDIDRLVNLQWPKHWKLQPIVYKSGGTFDIMLGKVASALNYAKTNDKVIIVIGANDVRDMSRTKGPYDPWSSLKRVVDWARLSSASVYIATPVPSPCFGPDEKKLPSRLRNPTWCACRPCAHELVLASTLRVYVRKLQELTRNITNIKLMDISSPF